MARPRGHLRFTLDEYLEFELEHADKFEYVDGLILAMAGGSLRHNVVAGNVFAWLHTRLAGRCRAMGSDQRVATADGLRTYPDVSVVCGKPEVSTYKGTATLHNPSLLVEVLSPSTREYDPGEKLERYQTIPSLRDVLLIEADTVDVRHVRRTAQGWETRRFHRADAVIDVAEIALPVAALYVGVDGSD